MAWIGQVLLLAHILVIANSHPHEKFPVYHNGVESDMVALAKQVSQDDFASVDETILTNTIEESVQLTLSTVSLLPSSFFSLAPCMLNCFSCGLQTSFNRI